MDQTILFSIILVASLVLSGHRQHWGWEKKFHPRTRNRITFGGMVCMIALFLFGNPANASAAIPLMAVIFAMVLVLRYLEFKNPHNVQEAAQE